MTSGLRSAAAAALILLVATAAAAQGQAQGKIVALNGRVEHTPAPREAWDAAKMFQPLLVAERVRTQEASRASILFIDETQVKLNAGAVLTIREVRSKGGAGTSLELSRGEGWFRTKNPASGLTIRTPAAAAAVRGTEINMRIGPANETVLTVVEGSAEFSNPQGSILVNAGEEGTAIPGQAPTKRVILNPEDAVQWALYYPSQVAWRDLPAAATTGAAATGFDRLRAGDAPAALQIFQANPADPWSRIGASMAYLASGDTTNARTMVAEATAAAASREAETERRAQLAAVALASGDIAAARREIDAVLAQDPSAVRALVLLSSLELRQNHPDQARDVADRALAARGDSVGALVAASEAAQSRFDLPAARRYLDRAIALDARDVHALVNRARIRFGTDDTRGAREDADRAAAVAPEDPQVRSLRGFIALGEGDAAAARADFEAASKADPEFGEPHLGLGLVYFRDNRIDDGLLEMLTATLLEPKVALYQSYLGKAYYQAQRFPEGLSALASAKRLDPRDPTPWLYTSFYLRDQNRQVDALAELRQAIALNDHRAVYRGRLLLDRDLATKNVSLAEIYRQLGFEAWGAFEALNSLEVDVTNASAHLFLAETYGGLPDRTQALSSELLQYFLYAPVNRNSFNNFAEYTALLEQPRRQLSVTAETGSRDRAYGDVVHRGGNERFAHVAFVEFAQQDGSRPEVRDDRLQVFFQGKVSLGRQSDLFGSFVAVRNETGASLDTTKVFGENTLTPIILRQFNPSPNPLLATRVDNTETTLGLKHQWRLGSALTAAVVYNAITQVEENPFSFRSACRFLDLTRFQAFSASTLTNPFRTFDVQIQQATRFGRHQLVVGQQFISQQRDERCEELITDPFGQVPLSYDRSGRDTSSVTSVRDEIQLSSRVHATVGVAYERAKYNALSSDRVFENDEWNPRVGISVRLAPSTVVRAAAFRNLNTNFFGSIIGPPTVAGFVVARNEFPTAKRNEFNASVEHGARRAFVAVRGFTRHTKVPFLLEGGGFIPEADAKVTGTSVYLNWIVAPRVTVFADDQFMRFSADAFNRSDNLMRGGINVIHPRGVFVRFTASHVRQRFSNAVVAGLPRSSFALADLSVTYEFAGKRGLASLALTNAFDRRFDAVIEGLSIDTFRPNRRALASLRWRLW
jgi:tetratricopeptide (TPR) repeat protein